MFKEREKENNFLFPIICNLLLESTTLAVTFCFPPRLPPSLLSKYVTANLGISGIGLRLGNYLAFTHRLSPRFEALEALL